MTVTKMKSPETGDPKSKFTQKYALRLDMESIKTTLTVGQYIGLQEGNIATMADLFSGYVWDKSELIYVDKKTALKVLHELPLIEFNKIARQLLENLDEEAVPKENEERSE